MTGYFEQAVPRYLPYEFKDHFRMTTRSQNIHLAREAATDLWSTAKGGLLFSKLFRLDRTDSFSFRPKFPEILVEWITPFFII